MKRALEIKSGYLKILECLDFGSYGVKRRSKGMRKLGLLLLEGDVRMEEMPREDDLCWWSVDYTPCLSGFQNAAGEVMAQDGAAYTGTTGILRAFLKSRRGKYIKKWGDWESANKKRSEKVRERIGGRLTLSHCLELSTP